MDAEQFDSLTRQFGTSTSRRVALGAGVAGGVLRALGFGPVAAEEQPTQEQAAQASTCTLAFAANVRLGPSLKQALTETGTTPGELRGQLRFALDAKGTLQNASLRLADGTSLPVIGEATGHALQVRITLAERVALVAVGVGEQPIADCRGAIDGVVTGPQVGDLGDWHAATSRQAGGGGATTTDNQGKQGKRAKQGATGASGQGGQGRQGGQGGASQGGAGAGAARATTGNPERPKGQRGETGGASGPSGPTGASGSTGATGATSATQCTTGQTNCNGTCVDLTSDANNCSACGIACDAGDVCKDSLCSPANGGAGCSTASPTRCGTTCADLNTDPNNCGACGAACGANEVCTGGVCGACTGGQTSCAGVCVDLSSDPANCGACAIACTGVDVCTDGQCITPVGPAPQACVQLGEVCDAALCCGGECVSRQDDTSICMCAADGEECIHQGTGGCCNGQPCNADGFCGVCGTPGTPCNSDAECCSGSQYAALCCFDGVSLTTRCTDVTNIGFVCPGESPAPESCPAGQTLCGNVCADLATDFSNCGACGNSCGLGGVCSGGVCGPAAPTCLVNGSPCTFGVDVCCAGLTCYESICQCSPPGDVCGDPTVCCSGVCNGEGFCD